MIILDGIYKKHAKSANKSVSEVSEKFEKYTPRKIRRARKKSKFFPLIFVRIIYIRNKMNGLN